MQTGTIKRSLVAVLMGLLIFMETGAMSLKETVADSRAEAIEASVVREMPEVPQVVLPRVCLQILFLVGDGVGFTGQFVVAGQAFIEGCNP